VSYRKLQARLEVRQRSQKLERFERNWQKSLENLVQSTYTAANKWTTYKERDTIFFNRAETYPSAELS